MRVLLDTHTFLWWTTGDPRLSPRAHKIISNGGNEIFLSAASGWEIAIKAKLGRLRLPDDIERFFSNQMAINAIEGLPVRMSHALHVYALPDYHQDPFDRLLIAQAQIEKLSLLTADSQISRYSVNIIW